MTNKYTITLSDGSTQFFVYNHEQNGPNNISTGRFIRNINLLGGAGTNYFEIEDDMTYRFVAGFAFTVHNSGIGSPNNDGIYTVAPAGTTYSAITNRTTIPVVEAIPTSGLPYGYVTYSIPVSEEATTLLLAGRGIVNYGEIFANNIVHLLENFNNSTAPANPIEGQSWYDKSTREMNTYKQVPNSPGSYEWVSNNIVSDVTHEPTGFPDRTSSAISFVDGTATFTIQPTGVSYDYYIAGVKYTETGPKNLVISDVEGLHFIYFDTTQTLQELTSFDVDVLFRQGAYICIIYWDAVNNQATYFGEERHGMIMDADTHYHLHTTLGTQYVSGLGLANIISSGDGSSDAHAEFSVGNGVIRDEDILITISNSSPQPLTPIAQIPVFYRSGTNGDWRIKTADNFPLIYDGTAGWGGGSPRVLPPYNAYSGSPGTWQLIEVPEGDYVLMHYLATNDINHPIIGIQGQNSYLDITSARDGANSELNTLVGLPFAEFTPIASVIFQCSSSYTNTPLARIQAATSGDYVDWRSVENFVVGAVPTQHGNLGGLLADDHPQYLTTTRGDARYYTQTQVDQIVSDNATAFDLKESVRMSTTAVLPSHITSGSGVGKTITSVYGMQLILDGVTANINDRVLIKNEQGAGAINNGIYDVTDPGTHGVSEVSSVTLNNDVAGSLEGTYFTLSALEGDYYVWYTTGGSPSTDPAPIGRTGIQVTYTLNDTGATLATLTSAALDAVFVGSPASYVFTTGILSNVLTITNVTGGSVLDIADGAIATGFAVSVTTQGVDGTPFILTRSTDADENFEVTAAMLVLIEEGATNADSGWILSTNNPIVVDTTQLTFVGFGGNGSAIPYYDIQVGTGAAGYTTPFAFTTPDVGKATLQVFVNGIKQIEGASKAYVSTAPSTVTFNVGSEPFINDDVEFYGLG